MMSRKLVGFMPIAGMIATALLASAPAASGGPPIDGEARFRPIQSISYEFGSKFMSGFFLQQSGTCLVYVMITERIDPDAPLRMTATRVRIALNSGQVAGLDSDEGHSLNLTCSDGGETLVVNTGDRDTLVAIQDRAIEEQLAKLQKQ
jgi:hypothetical protein